MLAALAFLCLPRQFHVAVVENTHLDDVRTAAWAFPLYLVAINLFVLPVAIAGLALFPDGGAQPDTFMVAIPRELGWPVLAFVAFLGGLSAATGMIIVATLALGTMVSQRRDPAAARPPRAACASAGRRTPARRCSPPAASPSSGSWRSPTSATSSSARPSRSRRSA